MLQSLQPPSNVTGNSSYNQLVISVTNIVYTNYNNSCEKYFSTIIRSSLVGLIQSTFQ